MLGRRQARHFRDVATSDEVPVRTRQNNDAHAVVGRKFDHLLGEARLHLKIKRVTAFWAVNGDHRDSVRIAAAENGLPFGIYCGHSASRHTRSMIAEMPCPTPTHMVQ